MDEEALERALHAWALDPGSDAGVRVARAISLMVATPSPRGARDTYLRCASVLRVHYLTPFWWSESERLRKLNRDGFCMSRNTYYRSLAFARAYVLGFLASYAADSNSASCVPT